MGAQDGKWSDKHAVILLLYSACIPFTTSVGTIIVDKICNEPTYPDVYLVTETFTWMNIYTLSVLVLHLVF